MGAKFCFCLPLRLGVSLFTMAQFLVSGAFAGLLWFALFAPATADQWQALAAYTRTTVIVVAAVYSFVALVGLLGFLGAIFKKNTLVRTYYVVLWISLIAQIAGGIWFLVQFFRARAEGFNIDQCEDLEDTLELPNDVSLCEGLANLHKVHPAVVIVPFVVANIIVGYVLYITHYFSEKLSDEYHAKKSAYNAPPRVNPAYAPVQTKQGEEGLPLTQPHGAQYPYSDSANAFGSNTGYNTGYNPVTVTIGK